MLACQYSHGIIIINIFKNLIKCQLDPKVFDEAVKLSNDEQLKNLLNIITRVNFEGSDFLRFLYAQLLTIRSHQWSSSQFTSSNAYDLSCGILRLFFSISKGKVRNEWKKMIEDNLDDFLDNFDHYSIQEFDVLVSFLDKGEFLGLNIGAICLNKQKDVFTIIGFATEWYDLRSPNSGDDDNDYKWFDLHTSLKEKDYIIGLALTDDYTKGSLEFFDPKEVTIVPCMNPNKSSNFLLSEGRLEKFIKATKIGSSPDKTDPISLTKRCTGLRILTDLMENHSDKVNELLGEKFKNNLVGILMKECTSKSEIKDNIPLDWVEQKLYVIKKSATEKPSALITKNESVIKFSGQVMSLSKPLKNSTKEVIARSVHLKAAMNYGKIEPSINYKVLPFEFLQSEKYNEENAVIVDSSKCDTVEKLTEIFSKCDTIVTSDVDIRKLHKELKNIDKKLAYFKTIVLIDKTDIEKFSDMLDKDQEIETNSTDEMSLNDTFVAEMSAFLGIEASDIKEGIKGFESENLSKKVDSLAKYIKEKLKKDKKGQEDEEKEEEEKEKKKKKEEADDWYNLKNFEFDKDYDYTQAYGLHSNEIFSDVVNQLGAYESGNYNLESEEKEENTADLYNEVYRYDGKDIEVEYLNTLLSFYKQLCRKSISNFFKELNMREILALVQEMNGNLETFINYVLLKGNEAAMKYHTTKESQQLEEFELMMTKLIKT